MKRPQSLDLNRQLFQGVARPTHHMQTFQAGKPFCIGKKDYGKSKLEILQTVP